jgi:hypothetical protein
MHDRPRQVLRRLVAEYGTALAHDPPRLASFLRDECGEHKAEIHVLVEAANARVPDDIATVLGEPIDIVVRRLAQRMIAEHGTTAEAASWAVASWAIALGRLDAAGAPGVAASALASTAAPVTPPAPVSPTAQDALQATPAGARTQPANPARSTIDRAIGLLKTPEGKPRWGVIGAIVVAVALVSGQFQPSPSDGPKREPQRNDAAGARITSVRYLQQFPADGRKAWFYVYHAGAIDRVEVQFTQGDWRNLTLRREPTAHGADFSFWLTSQQRQRGRARLTALSGNTPIGSPYEIEFAAVGAGDALLPATSSLAITDTRYERQVPADGSKHTVEVHFNGDDGGLMSLELAVLRGRLEHQVITYQPSASRNGKVTFILTAHKPESILLRARLVDAQGRLSAPREIPFDIVAQGRSPGAPARRLN